MALMKLITVVFITILIEAKAAKILAIYPCPSISHQVVFRPITLELLKRGHHVTVVTPDPMFPNGNAPQNLTEIDVHDTSYAIIRNELPTAVAGTKTDAHAQMKLFIELFPKILEEQMKLEKVRKLIFNQTEDYDLISLEALFTPALAISYKYKVPTVLISSFGPPPDSREIMGIPIHPFVYPTMTRQRIYNLTLWEKLNELSSLIGLASHYKSFEGELNKMIKRMFWPDSPALKDLGSNVDMLFLYLHPMWEGSYPVPPNVIHMGGLHQKQPKSLPQELQQYLDASNMGVIYFSFGTNVKPSLLPSSKIAIFEKVFAQLSYNVIWKWDDDNFKAKSSNVKIVKLAPQSDLLRHPNVKAFITQGGLQSTDEAITAEVPLIGIPMLGDQWFNVKKYVHHKIGVHLDFKNLKEAELKNAIIEVIENKSYKENIGRLRSLMSDQPPLEKAIWWIEYVIRNGGAKQLRSPAANISWAQFLETDLIGLLLFLAFITIVLIVVFIRILVQGLSKLCKYKLKKKQI